LKNFATARIDKVKEYVVEYIDANFPDEMCYHNVMHTLDVVDAVQIIGEATKVSLQDMEVLIVAAWFHDTGYFKGCQDHEQASAALARDFLTREKANEEFIRAVERCILATKIPQKPQDLLEKVICDADLYHLGSENFFEKSELLLRELTHTIEGMTRNYWLRQSKSFIESHQYHTDYGKAMLAPRMRQNLRKLSQKISSTG
jgi:predicted metal-dependent HD superfamily phosphohydrolase